MKPLFLDAGYVIALEASDDENHQAADDHWRELLQSLPPLVTTSYVFDEIVTFFKSRRRHVKAVEVGNNLLQSSEVELVHGWMKRSLMKGGGTFKAIATRHTH